ncbi:hypothetical protein CRYUN_Cryun20dG0127200 [Craigia yunnanensis]
MAKTNADKLKRLRAWVQNYDWGRCGAEAQVLSAAKALSIQAHPDKALAKELHKLQPNLYKDGNHKPEMALAITEFRALCGFITLEELKGVLEGVPEIVELVGTASANQVLDIDE